MRTDRRGPGRRNERDPSGLRGRTGSRWPQLGLVLLAVLLAQTMGTGTARAQVNVVVRVTIERVLALDCVDELEPGCDPIYGEADFYAVVWIDGTEYDNKPANDPWEQQDDISPNWQFSLPVDVARGSIPVGIRIYDEDGLLRGDDDPVDVSPIDGRRVDMDVNLAPCSVSGELSGSCGTTLISEGTSGDDDATIWFKIVVEEPPSAPGLRVQCIHDPIWPGSTDTVTITANALDGALAPRVADNIEIWVDPDGVDPKPADPLVAASGGVTLTHSVGPFAGPTFAYGCRVQDNGLTVWTGWRVVHVGLPSAGFAVPVLYHGPSPSRIDILFIADRDNYAGAGDPAFLDAVRDVILGSYYADSDVGRDLFLRNQDKYNFWIALEMGDAENDCEHDPPDMDHYPFADAGAILHADSLRDCALTSQRVFSTEPTSLGTVLHESGHAPFGLADEYCNERPGGCSSVCDGGYWESYPGANLYEELATCQADAPSLGRTAADCQGFTSQADATSGEDFFTSDPACNDLMVDNLTTQAADIRRIEWMFGECAQARC